MKMLNLILGLSLSILCWVGPSFAASGCIVYSASGGTLGVTVNGQGSCLAVDSVGRSITAPATFVSNSLAFGSVSTSYATILTNTNKARFIDCVNGLDKEVRLSTDGTNDTLGAIPSGSGKLIPLASVGLHVSSNISVKSIAAVASGNVTCTLGY